MDRLISPGIFNSYVTPVRKPGQGFFSNGVKAFFTKKPLGVDINEICRILSIRKEEVCVPILISDMKNAVVGAVHAGWRSTAARILKKAIQLMIQDFHSSPGDIKIALGPSIRWSCYYVGDEVKDAVYKATGEGAYYLQKDGRYCIDLPSANMYQALSMGIPKENIWISNECTYCSPNEYN